MDQFTEFVVNNWALFIALVVIVVLLARTWLGPGGIKGIGPMEAVSLSNHKNGVFVDVRTDDEYRKGHILHAYHAPLGLIDNKLKDLAKYKHRPVVVYCRSGNRSGSAGATLKKHGFEHVFNLSGGVMAWQNANLPLTKDTTPPPSDDGPAPGSKNPSPEKSEHGAAIQTQDEATSAPEQIEQEQQTPQQQAVANSQEKVVVYTTQRCPFCVRAVNLLNNKGIGYKEINIENDPLLREEMEHKAKRKTVPQIFIGDIHVGGCDDMYELENKGRLDPLLGLK